MSRVFYRPTTPFTSAHYEPFRSLLREAFAEVTDATKSYEVRLDVKEAANEYTVVAELPGVNKEAIHVEINGADIKIAANTKEGESFQRSYARSFTLPLEIDDEKAAAQYENGILRLTLPKKSANAAKRLLVA